MSDSISHNGHEYFPEPVMKYGVWKMYRRVDSNPTCECANCLQWINTATLDNNEETKG